MKKYKVTIYGPDHWEPTKEQMERFIHQGIKVALQHGMGINRYMLKVEDIKEDKS